VAGRLAFLRLPPSTILTRERDRRSDLRTDGDQALIALAVVVLAYGFVR
jgi:hypothetical protein